MIRANDIIEPDQVKWNDEVECLVSNRSTTLRGYIEVNGRHKRPFERKFDVDPQIEEGYYRIGVKLNRANVASLVLQSVEDADKQMEVALGDLLTDE